VAHKVLDTVHKYVFESRKLNLVPPQKSASSAAVLAFVCLILQAKAPGQAPTGHAPDGPTLLPTDRKNISIRAPFHGTDRPSFVDMIGLNGLQHLRFWRDTALRWEARVFYITTR
jgi:hypothetical protein